MNFGPLFRQRLPCVGLFLAAAAGVIAGRYILLPGWAFALCAAAFLAAACFRKMRAAILPGVALVFAAEQAWQFRESAAVQLAAQLSGAPQACEATIVALEAPHISASSQRCRFAARLRSLQIGGRTLPADCRVIVFWDGEPPVYGGEYKVRASISNCPPQRNPGTFDYSAWLADTGIRSQLDVLRASDARLIRVGGNPIVRFAIASCAWIERTIALGIEGTPEAVLIKAMTIGDMSDAPDSMKDAFRETGTFHLFSVSGLHVGIVAVMLWAALSMLGIGQRTSVLVIIPCLFFYALITGLSAASIRATIMLSFIAAGLLIDRAPIALNSVGAAGLLLLLWDSSQLFNSGFQLSFGAVAAICIIAGPLQRRLGVLVAPDPFIPPRLIPPVWRTLHGLAGGAVLLIAVSFAAWLASLPLIVYYFHLVSFSSIPANLLAVPLSSVILALAAISLVAGAVSPWLAGVFNHANYLLAKILIAIVNAFASLPGSAVYFGPPQPPGTIARLVVLDSAGGGATALFAGSRAWLVDCGSEFFADTVTLPFLRTNGVNQLDAFVLTHGDAKHIGGFDHIAPQLHPRLVLDSGLTDRSPMRRRILASTAVQPANAVTVFGIGPSASVTVLYPPPNAHGVRADDKAIVLRIDAGKFSALLMSDAGIATEQWLLAHSADRLPCDLIAMGRHSSGFSGGEDFLRAAHPRALVASCGTFPVTEQIRPEWARSVRALGIDLLRQDDTGAVTVTVKADSFIVAPFLSTGGAMRTFPNAPLR